jgi:hypothetical protein
MTTMCETCDGRGCWTCHQQGLVRAVTEATRYEVVKVTPNPARAAVRSSGWRQARCPTRKRLSGSARRSIGTPTISGAV